MFATSEKYREFGREGATDWLKRIALSNEFGLFALIVVAVLVFSSLASGFLSNFNLYLLGRIIAVNTMIGFSMMVVLVTGGLNLAVGAIGVCVAMTCGWLIEDIGLPWYIAIALAIVVGAGLGAINGLLVVWSGLHSFIITLATMSIFFGGMIFLTRAESFREMPGVFTDFSRLKFFGSVSAMLIPTCIVAVLLGILYRLTRTGKEMLAAGAQPAAAEQSGLRVKKLFVLCHVLSGAVAGCAGLMLLARNGAAIPAMAGNLGQDWLLIAFLGPVLGGAVLLGGYVSVLGAFLGATLVSVLSNGLLLIQVGEFWVQACLGLMLLLAVVLDKVRRLFVEN
ncbi:ABC transporter permease [uncultured Ruegeria sp.]|uniref:ABC transporter permease n=1 Tax=uncultured Ruegeria sp. TaxID=259304 RepID=UPI00261086B9|nr:ABC transporter permease [uncultured Ruegeria sp.]